MHSKLQSYLILGKLGITKLILITTAIGFLVSAETFSLNQLQILFCTLLGTAQTCLGSGMLNNYLERDYDLRMERTSNRPIQRGDIKAENALAVGLLLVLFGTVQLVITVNLLTGFLALLTSFLYVLVYTPLKRLSTVNTFIGAIPGALPVLGGSTAAAGEIVLPGLILFMIMFFWQMPHFYAIAWMYKDQYKNAGFKMISVDDLSGHYTFTQIVVFSFILIFSSILPAVLNGVSYIYLISAGLLGLGVLAFALSGLFSRTYQSARKMLYCTIIYLPLLFGALVFDCYL